MNKRQYTFLGLMIILLYLSFKILDFEYRKYTISKYIKQQMLVINDIKKYLINANDILEYISTRAFKNKTLKEDGKKMKGEDVIILTSQKTYNKFSGNTILLPEKDKREIKETNITKTMKNYQKWIYFLLKKDIR